MASTSATSTAAIYTDPTSRAALQLTQSVLNEDIKAITFDPNGAAHGAGLQQLMFWMSPTTCDDAQLVQALQLAFAPTWKAPAQLPSEVPDGAASCADALLEFRLPQNTSMDILVLIFCMCFTTLFAQISRCFASGPIAADIALRSWALEVIQELMFSMLAYDAFEGSLTDYLARMAATTYARIDDIDTRVQDAIFTPGIRLATVFMMTPFYSIKYLSSFDPTGSDRATNFFDARYSEDCTFAVFSDALRQLTTMTPTTTRTGFPSDTIDVLETMYINLTTARAAVAETNAQTFRALYEKVSDISTATRTVSARLKGVDREIALRTGVTGAQLANVESSRARLRSERLLMWCWISAVVLTTVVAACLIAAGHTQYFWLLAVIVFIVVGTLAVIGFFRTPHPSNDTSY